MAIERKNVPSLGVKRRQKHTNMQWTTPARQWTTAVRKRIRKAEGKRDRVDMHGIHPEVMEPFGPCILVRRRFFQPQINQDVVNNKEGH